ncbi:monovalent cation:proton antiporter-2 (CPA2) family protein [Pseudoxanthomonas daejeonensis]|uniref:Potassium transporter n=1 Tax=Pseudoxanthomonas daejeonensis TaxID=266062 RepID=A0ABQ6Z4N5_9GAMM|nr:monovalent cation:proton antiporter-2 (CPA2) family protein [Pseudoxanthomonas daejeonensis]KAF1693019.1 potassium transporter [Pseudoxanthomonas daejeonensis]UNK57414.1 monovalent cation:proton antiporter-2 (CPA2) family protein [Pseudoxanthomonas daejeonensis]
MAVEGTTGSELVSIVALLGAAVVMVPIFRRLGLGSVLGYLCAGLLIGPFGLRWFTDPQAILHVAELGVVMFLFVIGLEMRPSHLWGLRREIFGLGTLQIGVCTAVLTGVAMLLGLPPRTAFIGAAGFVLTSTAIVMQLLSERGDIALPRGQKIVSILLFEDLLIVPLLALVAFLSPLPHDDGGGRWVGVAIAVAALAGLVAAGIWLLNPLFRLLAAAKAREVMTAAALLVVLGAALLMEIGGLSMAMGAFLAGVLLSESTFRHQLEADIEPFRGLLLGLFFLAVGMALDLAVVAANWPLIASGVVAMMVAKGVCIYAVARITRSGRGEALDRAVLMAQGGEFAFVLFAAAQMAGVIDSPANANLTAIVVLSMALTPLVVLLVRRFVRTEAKLSMDGIDAAEGLGGSVLIIGFGRFGQVMSQALLARDVDVTIIDTDIEMIRSAGEFGFKVYYGDGRRLDVLHASGAGTARALAVCIDDRAAANQIAELCHGHFPQAKVLVRAFDREHALELVALDVDYQIRETFESAVRFGQAALEALGVDADEAARVSEEMRRLDAERFSLEVAAGDIRAGRPLIIGNTAPATPTPFTTPRRESQRLDASTGGDAAGEGGT